MSEERTGPSASRTGRDRRAEGGAHGYMDHLDELRGPGDAPDELAAFADALRTELVEAPADAVRSAHLAAMGSTLPAAAGWALRFRRARIRHALAAAGLKVALVSTAAAAGTGALAVPGDVLPPSVQRAVASTVAPLGVDLPSPVDDPSPDAPEGTETEAPAVVGSPSEREGPERTEPPRGRDDDRDDDDQGEDVRETERPDRDRADEADDRGREDESEDRRQDDERDDESERADEREDESERADDREDRREDDDRGRRGGGEDDDD